MRGTTSAANLPKIVKVSFEDDSLIVHCLAHGSLEERANFQISSAGYGIHWPDLDEDIGVEGLLLGIRRAVPPLNDG
jgi:hypothetical protein